MERAVLIRGALSWDKRPHQFIQNVIDSVRTWHKGKIILSTWEDDEDRAKSLIGVDKIIFNPDPGRGPVQNFNRQLTNFYNGLKHVDPDSEVLVIRTDTMCFRDLFSIRGRHPQKMSTKLTIFSEKVLVSNMMTIRPGCNETIDTFRISDWIHCGSFGDISKVAKIYEDIKSLDWKKISSMEESGQMCTEKLWSLMMLKRFCPEVSSEYDSSSIDNFAWDFILNNYEVIDQYSTAYAVNLNYGSQPERLDCYLAEHQYHDKYQEVTNV